MDQDFVYKLQSVLIAISEIWDTPEYEQLNEVILASNVQQGGFGYPTLSSAQEAFTYAEKIASGNEQCFEHVCARIERWKQERTSL